MILLLSCLTDPLQRLRGFLYLAPSSGISSLIFSKSEYLITASPRSISSPLYGIVTGTLANILALPVITSPTSPFPLVTALVISPLLYVRTIVNPSIFHDSRPFWLPSHDTSSSTLLVLPRLNIGFS